MSINIITKPCFKPSAGLSQPQLKYMDAGVEAGGVITPIEGINAIRMPTAYGFTTLNKDTAIGTETINTIFATTVQDIN